MLKILLGIIFICICGLGCMYYAKLQENKKILLTSSQIVPLKTVVCFSIYELTKRLKWYYGKDGEKILIEYADKKYIELDTKESQEELIEKLDKIQDFMISKRYKPDEIYVVKDNISKIMHDIWLDYAYKSNYKNLFWREMNRMFSEAKVPKSSYNEIYRRFYMYKYL